MLRRIPLGKMNNLRDLGGYPAGDGVTVWERFLRGDNPTGLSEQDIQWLRERDITTIVDLRSGEELARQPDQLRGQPGFLYHHCPLVGIEKLPNLEADIGRAHFEAMDRLTCVGRAMRILAAAPGGVLFHCTAGKDRTGILAMLLLSLAGVAREDILADYQISETYLAEIIQLIQLRVRVPAADLAHQSLLGQNRRAFKVAANANADNDWWAGICTGQLYRINNKITDAFNTGRRLEHCHTRHVLRTAAFRQYPN